MVKRYRNESTLRKRVSGKTTCQTKLHQEMYGIPTSSKDQSRDLYLLQVLLDLRTSRVVTDMVVQTTIVEQSNQVKYFMYFLSSFISFNYKSFNNSKYRYNNRYNSNSNKFRYNRYRFKSYSNRYNKYISTYSNRYSSNNNSYFKYTSRSKRELLRSILNLVSQDTSLVEELDLEVLVLDLKEVEVLELDLVVGGTDLVEETGSKKDMRRFMRDMNTLSYLERRTRRLTKKSLDLSNSEILGCFSVGNDMEASEEVDMMEENTGKLVNSSGTEQTGKSEMIVDGMKLDRLDRKGDFEQGKLDGSSGQGDTSLRSVLELALRNSQKGSGEVGRSSYGTRGQPDAERSSGPSGNPCDTCVVGNRNPGLRDDFGYEPVGVGECAAQGDTGAKGRSPAGKGDLEWEAVGEGGRAGVDGSSLGDVDTDQSGVVGEPSAGLDRPARGSSFPELPGGRLWS